MSVFSMIGKLLGVSKSGKAADEPECMSEIFGWVAEEMDPRIRRVSGYKRRLKPSVIHACNYIDGLVEKIPGPVDIRPEKWEENPMLNAFFVTSDEIRRLVASSPGIQKMLQKNSPSGYCAFLVMSKTESRNFGTEMQGEIMKRDVIHTSVTFRDHRIDAVFPSEEELRNDLRKRGIKLLMTLVLENILSLEEWISELEEQKHLLEMHLKIRDSRQRSLASLLVSGSEEAPENREAAKILQKIEEKLVQLHAQLHTPEDIMNQVIKVLMHPEKCLGIEKISMKISPMNILLAPDAGEKGTEITLAQFRIKGEEQKWVGIIVRVGGKDS
ncbi:MAG: hypothetical protein AB7S75_06640 [Desulfococcaceae bacterium]